MKLTEKFRWPLWHFLVAVVLSLMLTPAINASVSWLFLFHRICVAGYIIFAVLYFGGWLKTRRRIEWAICLACTFAMPFLASVATSFAATVLYPKP